MSDYMFMLESHLSAEQSRVVADVQATAAAANLNLFLAGGAIRDILGGFTAKDLDFVVEGNALKLAQTVAEATGAAIREIDEHRGLCEVVFPNGVVAEIAMARREKYGRPGSKPQVSPAAIYEDLRGRDFTVNALALSLNRASRGLLLDPANGVADLQRKELRAVSNYALHDDPVRLLRLLRLKTRFGYGIAERTKSQYDNAREAGVEKYITAPMLLKELRHIASEPNAGDVLRVLEEEKLLDLYSPALSGEKLNRGGFQKLQKAKALIPFGIPYPMDNLALLLWFLSEKLSPKERSQFTTSLGLSKEEAQGWQKLEGRAKKLEITLAGAKIQRPSQLWRIVAEAPGEDVVFVFARSTQRLVLDRIRNFFQKYLPAAMEVTDRDVMATGAKPGSAKWRQEKARLIAARLDGRMKKEPPLPPAAPDPVPFRARARGGGR